MPTFLKLYFQATAQGTLEHFIKQCKNAYVLQDSFLGSLISRNQTAQYGYDYGFKKIRNYQDFCREVPINTYESLKPYIERAMKGRKFQLPLDEPNFFATTSGTTGLQKYIPVTPFSGAQKAALMKVWISKLFLDHPTIFDGKNLTVISPEEESRTRTGLPCGAESGHAYRKMPF